MGKRMAWGIACAVVALIVLPFLFVGNRSRPATATTRPAQATDEDPLEEARQALAKPAETNVVRSALRQINAAISKATDSRPPSLQPDEAATLEKTCALRKDELDEISATTYSLLDAPHLEYCLLLRDAARSLDARVTGIKASGTPEVRLEQARQAFDWVMRQVRIYAGPPTEAGRWATPDLALRRGTGTALDRGLIFLDLLRQIGSPKSSMPEITGAVMVCRKGEEAQAFWACAVDVGGDQGLYVFDPALGIPLPGPEGKGIATLGEIATRAEVLEQLRVPGAPKYGFTREQAAAAQINLYCSLSALAPRMRHLQDELLPPAIEVRLAVDLPGELARLQKAAAHDRKNPPVGLWKEGLRIWRNFLMPNEGGVAEPVRFALHDLPGFTPLSDLTEVGMPPKEIFRLGLVPWIDLPGMFRNPVDFPYRSGLGSEIRNRFGAPFQMAVMAPGPRDLLLRGRMREAIPRLVAERDIWSGYERQMEGGVSMEMAAAIPRWKERAVSAYASSVTSATPEQKHEALIEINQLWKDAGPVMTMLLAGAGQPRNAQIAYTLAQCKHEEAERMQARLNLLEKDRRADDTDRQKTAATWREALSAWTTFLRDYEKHADRFRAEMVAARELRGRAQAKLGDFKAAVADWKNTAVRLLDPEKLANFYHANLRPEQYR
jgi:hypothetical protein